MTKSSRKNRSRRRRAVIPRKVMDLAGPTVSFHRKDTITLPKTAGDSGNALWTTLSSFTSSDIVSLFSFYKVTQVKLTFRLVNAPNNNANFPTLWVAPRQFSILAPTSLDEVQQYNGVRSYQFGPSKNSFSMVFKPAIQLVTRTSGVAAPGATMPMDWIATDNDTAAFIFAVYWLQRYSTTDSTHTIELDYDLSVVAKQPR